MSLLNDLQSIDLSGIVSARGSIRVSVQNPELQAVVSGGAAQTALAGLGESFGSLRENFQDPSAILRPIVDAVGGLRGRLSADNLPIDRYISAVSEGVTIAARFVEGIDRDPMEVGRILGASMSDQMTSLTRLLQSYTQIGGADLTLIRSQLEQVDRGVPSGAGDLANLTMDLLLPFPRQPLLEIRGGLDTVFQSAASISLPSGRTTGLLAALDAVNAAALAADTAALDRAIRGLAEARDNTIHVIEGDLLRIFDQIGRIRIDQLLDPMARASAAIHTGQEGVLEFLEKLRLHLQRARNLVETLDPTQIIDFLEKFLVDLEREARLRIVVPIEAQVARIEDFVRSLFHRLPLRALRAEITQFLHSIAEAIQNAGLDRVAQAVHDALATVRSALSAGNLTDQVQEAVQRAGQIVNQALDGVIQAVENIGQQINAVADQAQQILDRATNAITSFAQAVEETTAAIDGLGIEAASDQVVESLRSVREKAEQLLSVAPLPEPMRPVVEQLISTLENVDFDVVFRPVRSAAEQIAVPAEIGNTVTEALQAVKDALDNLIPAQLIASIEAEVDAALDVIRSFDPSSLLSGVTQYLEEAAQFLEGLDPRPVVSQIRGPFQTVLDAVDTVQPRRILAPVISAYDSVMSQIHMPAADLGARRLGELINSSAESIGQSATEPMRSLLTPPAATDSAGGAAGAAPGEDLPTFRPGDVIRILGFFPAKLREGLQALEAGPAGDVMRTLDGLTGGLARDIRRLQAEIYALETRVTESLNQTLIPLGAAQVRAQVSIRANFAGGVQVDGALAAVAQAGPGAIRHELARTLEIVLSSVRNMAANAGGGAGAALEHAAAALDQFRISRLTDDLDGFLAALDPEPLAHEMDELVAAALRRVPVILEQMEQPLTAALDKLRELIAELNPGAQAQKFLRVLDVLKEEMDILNPAVLADELGEIHTAIRKTIAAYDPANFAADLFATLQEMAQSLRALNPSSLLGDLASLDDIANRVQAAAPAQALAGVGESLSEVGDRLAELDPAGLLEAISDLGPRIVAEFEDAVKKIRDEIVALLEAIRYANANASVSVSASVEVG